MDKKPSTFQIILDYGCPTLFTAIVLTNSNDGGGGTRTTGAFTVYGTNDFVNLTALVTGTLADPGAATVSLPRLDSSRTRNRHCKLCMDVHDHLFPFATDQFRLTACEKAASCQLPFRTRANQKQ
jgi:hypothetical protein